MPKFTPGSLHARSAAHASWAKTANRTQRTEKARAAALARFEHEVDPDGKLPSAERRQRAQNAIRAYFLNLAAKSAAVRAGRGQR